VSLCLRGEYSEFQALLFKPFPRCRDGVHFLPGGGVDGDFLEVDGGDCDGPEGDDPVAVDDSDFLARSDATKPTEARPDSADQSFTFGKE
jgi:hypothetical protein